MADERPRPGLSGNQAKRPDRSGRQTDALQRLLEDTLPVAILLTHSHFDHTGALEPMRRALNVPVMAHPEFAGAAIDRGLADGESIAVGRHRLRVRHTPAIRPTRCASPS